MIKRFIIGYYLRSDVGVAHYQLRLVVESAHASGMTEDQALATIRERVKQHPDRKYILQEYYAAE